MTGKANETKSVHVTFTLRKERCPSEQRNNVTIPKSDIVKYLGFHFDRRLTWRKHFFTKRKQLGLKFRDINWLIGRNSQLTKENKQFHQIL